MTGPVRIALVVVLVVVAAAVAGAVGMLLVGGAGGPGALPWSTGQWTDGRSVQVECDAIDPRRVLWETAAPLREEAPGVAEGASATARVNSRLDEYEPRVVAAGTTMLFVRGRPGRNSDLWSSQWTPHGWSEPQPLATVNTDADELGPELSLDGTRLLFYSDRHGGLGGYDLWMARRLDDGGAGAATGGWSTPVNLGPAVNSPFNEYGPALHPDGTRLFFASNRPRPDEPGDAAPGEAWSATVRERRTRHDYDLYAATLVDGEPAHAQALVGVNTESDEGSPAVSPAGDFLWFASDRAGGLGGLDLYRTRLREGEPTQVERLDHSVNSPWHELDPALSAEGFRLVFSSDRPLDADAAIGVAPFEPPRDYNLWSSVSREVWLEATPSPSLAEALTPLLPWILMLLLAALLLWLLSRLLRNQDLRARLARLSLLTQCLLASLLLHTLLTFLLAVWHVGTGLNELLRPPGGTRVVLEGSAAAAASEIDGITAQVRGEVTSIELATVVPAIERIEPPAVELAAHRPEPISFASLPPSSDADRREPAALEVVLEPGERDVAEEAVPAAPDARVPSSETVTAPSSPSVEALAAPAAPLPSASAARRAELAPAARPEVDVAASDVAALAVDVAPPTPVQASGPAVSAAGEPAEEHGLVVDRQPMRALPAPRSAMVASKPPITPASLAPSTPARPDSLRSPLMSAAGGAAAGALVTEIALPARSDDSSNAAAVPRAAAPAATSPATPEPAIAASRRSIDALAAPRVTPAARPLMSQRMDVAVPARGSSTTVPQSTLSAPLRSTDAVLDTAPARLVDGPRLPDVPPDVVAPEPVETFAQRDPESRAEVLERMGGSAETERAVARALEWFARHQARDGRWSAGQFDHAPATRAAGAASPTRCGCDRAAEVPMDLATTSLALLCFLGAGHSQAEEGPYRATVESGLAWIVARQAPDGDLRRSPRGGEEADTMYGQTIAAVALCEAYAMTSDVRLAEAAGRAVRFVIDRTEASRRGRTAPEDTSVLGWQLMVFASARRAGIDVPPRSWSHARTWLESVSVPGAPGRYAYVRGGAASVAMTAEAMFVRQLLDELDGRQPESARMEESARFIASVPPKWTDDAPTHHWYYATLALHHHQGDTWRGWNKALAPALVAQQRGDGCAAGSWNPQDEWSTLGGRLYQTAVCTLSLEAYYRYGTGGSE